MDGERIAAEKRELRAQLRERLRRLPHAVRAELSDRAARALDTAPQWRGAAALFSFLSLANEVDTDPIHRAALARALPLAFPRVEHHELRFRLVADLDGPWDHNRYRIREPRAELPHFALADAFALVQGAGRRPAAPAVLLLVPGLAFDRTGGRLGRGGGYYDRFLAGARGATARPLARESADRAPASAARDAPERAPAAASTRAGGALLVVGVCFSFQLVERVPTASFDERVDFVLSEEGLLRACLP